MSVSGGWVKLPHLQRAVAANAKKTIVKRAALASINYNVLIRQNPKLVFGVAIALLPAMGMTKIGCREFVL